MEVSAERWKIGESSVGGCAPRRGDRGPLGPAAEQRRLNAERIEPAREHNGCGTELVINEVSMTEAEEHAIICSERCGSLS